MGYLFLALAIIGEVIATTFLKLTSGEKPAIWAGVGVVLVAVISWVVFHETLTWQQLVGMGLVVGGVVLLELGGKH